MRLLHQRKRHNNIYMSITSKPLLFTALLSFFMALVLYWEIIVSGTPLFMTTGDGWAHAWPFMAALSDYIWTDGFPQWHFGDGLGAPFFYPMLLTNPFRLIPILLGRDILPYAMVWMQILKIVLACLFFYLFLQKMQFHPYVCSLVSLMYAFSGHMIIRGANWIVYGVEVVVIAFLLYAVELYFRDGKWKLVPIAVCLIGMSLGSYHMYLYSLFLFTYATIRYIYSNKFKLKDYAVFILKCGVLYGIGALAAGIALLPATLLMLMSSRGQAAVDSIGAVFLLDNLLMWHPRILLTAFFRFFSGVSLGTGEIRGFGEYGGITNTLEDSLHYAGVLMIVLVPVFFYYANKKLRILGLIGIASSALYYLSPKLRSILNAFVSTWHFKISTFWITIIALFMAAYALDKIFRNNNSLSLAPAKIVLMLSIALATAFVALGLLAVNYNVYVNVSISISIVIFVMIYASLLYDFLANTANVNNALNKTISKFFTFTLIFFVTITELFTFSSLSKNYFLSDAVNFPQRLFQATSSEFVARDSLIEAIEESDDGFYRIAVSTPHPIWQTAPLADGFFSSSFYSSLQNMYMFFLEGSHLPTAIVTSGLQNRFKLQTLTSHKYMILPSDFYPPFGYSYLFSYENRSVYLNDYYLPLGFAYDSFIAREQFDSLRLNEQKDIALLSAVVLETPNDALDNADISVLDYSIRQVELSRVHELSVSEHVSAVYGQLPHRLEISSTGIDPFVYFHVDSDYEGDFLISIDITSLHEDTFAQVFWSTPETYFHNETSHIEHINAGERTTIRLTVDKINLSMLRIDPGAAPGDFIIENLIIEVDETYLLYSQAATARRAESFEMTSFSHNHITGTIETFGDRMLFFSIPNEEGWRLYIDGESVPIETVNIGFIGTFVGEGFHHIELRYRLPGLVIGSIMTGLGLAMYVVMLVLDKKNKLRFIDIRPKTVQNNPYNNTNKGVSSRNA